MSILETRRKGWTLLRSVEASSDDFPQTTTNYNPVGTPATDRIVARMLTKAGAALPVINLDAFLEANILELRFRFTNNDATCTWHLFGTRKGSDDVKYIGSILATAGTQAAADGTFFAKTLDVVDYWNKGLLTPEEEAGTGMATLEMDTRGYNRFWLATTTTSGVSAASAFVDYAWV